MKSQDQRNTKGMVCGEPGDSGIRISSLSLLAGKERQEKSKAGQDSSPACRLCRDYSNLQWVTRLLFLSTRLMKPGSHEIGPCCWAYRAVSEPGMIDISLMSDDLRSEAGAFQVEISDVLSRPVDPALQPGTSENLLVGFE